MSRVPPIQFIMDNPFRQTREVEELLAVADMGPDFEPTPLENILTSRPDLPHDYKTTDLSCRSEINVSEVAGPGGSVELVSSKTGDHKLSFAQHSETWNSNCEGTWSLRAPEDVINEKFDREKTGGEQGISIEIKEEEETACDSLDDHHGRFKNKPAAVDNATYTSDVRSDIYGLDHARLWQQVLLAKRKSVNRSYGLSEELISHYSAAADNVKTGSTCDLLARSKIRKHNKNGRLCRNRDYLLSSHYHNNID